MANHVQVLTWHRKEREIERVLANKELMAFYWLSPCQKRRGLFFILVGLCYCNRAWELPLLVSQLYLIEVSVY